MKKAVSVFTFLIIILLATACGVGISPEPTVVPPVVVIIEPTPTPTFTPAPKIWSPVAENDIGPAINIGIGDHTIPSNIGKRGSSNVNGIEYYWRWKLDASSSEIEVSVRRYLSENQQDPDSLLGRGFSLKEPVVFFDSLTGTYIRVELLTGQSESGQPYSYLHITEVDPEDLESQTKGE